ADQRDHLPVGRGEFRADRLADALAETAGAAAGRQPAARLLDIDERRRNAELVGDDRVLLLHLIEAMRHPGVADRALRLAALDHFAAAVGDGVAHGREFLAPRVDAGGVLAAFRL